MKKSHILALGVIIIAVIVIISTTGGASSYVDFKTAQEMVAKDASKPIHIVGQLKTDEEGEFIGIQEAPNKLNFTFVMVDENGGEETVFYNNPMPADFLKSEQVVVVGQYIDNQFVADNVLLKCPSKYQEETEELTSINKL